MPNAVVSLQLQSQVAPQIAQTANAYKVLSAEEQKAERAATAYALALQKVALADAKTATEEQRLAIQTANATKAQTQAEAAALRLAQAQAKAAGGNSFAADTAQAFGSQLAGMVGPAALAAGAIGVLVGTANSFKEAFAFKAQLDQTTASIAVQLAGVRDSGQVFAEAAGFANTYKLTQEETTDAIRASLPVIRSSNASVGEILGTLSRLRVLNPEQDFAGAARALAELKAGQVVSIVDRFNIARSSANAMKKEIEGGGDAVLVLSKYLDSAGVGMDALKVGASGASGAMRELAQEQERLELAQAGFAQGPGLALLAAQANVTAAATRILTGNLKETNAEAAAGAAAQAAYTSAMQDGAGVAQANAAAQAAYAAAIDAGAPALANQAAASDSAATAAEYYASRVVVAGNAAANAAPEVDKLTDAQLRQANAQGLAQQRAGERAPGTSGAAEGAAAEDARAQLIFQRLAQVGIDAAAAEAARLQDARDRLALSRATTVAQRVAILRRQQARATTEEEKIAIQIQIEQAQKGGAARISTAQSTALKLNDIARTSGDDRARIERENLEKLRDAQQDFDVKSSRAQEDYEEKRKRLLAGGQRAQAAQLAQDFAKEQRRAKEDFDRDRQRTVRNANEALGDQATRVGNRVESIGARTAARGGAVQGLSGAPGGGAAGALPPAPTGGGGGATLAIQGVVMLDGKAVGNGVWPTIQILVDQDLSISLQQIGVPGSGQAAIAGVG